jgi:CheY-like chemotaxis protein
MAIRLLCLLACETFPDLAILNVAMPRKDGLSAAREIRQKLKIPVILLMSDCDPETLIRSQKDRNHHDSGQAFPRAGPVACD